MLAVPMPNHWTGLTACYQSGYCRYAAFFMSVIYLPFCFLGGYFGEPSGSPVSDPVCQPDLSALPCLAWMAVSQTVNKGAIMNTTNSIALSAIAKNNPVIFSKKTCLELIWRLESVEVVIEFLREKLASFTQGSDAIFFTSDEANGFHSVLHCASDELQNIESEINSTPNLIEIGKNLKKALSHASFILNSVSPTSQKEFNNISGSGVESIIFLINKILSHLTDCIEKVGFLYDEANNDRGAATLPDSNNHSVAEIGNTYEAVISKRIEAIQPKFTTLYNKYIFPGGSQLLTDPDNLGLETEALRNEIWKLQNQMPVESEESMDCGLAIDQLDFLIRLISARFEFRESDLITLSMIVDQASHVFSGSLGWIAPDDGGDLVDSVH